MKKHTYIHTGEYEIYFILKIFDSWNLFGHVICDFDFDD